MRNSKITKAIILNKSAILFNTKGYHNTSLSDIISQTGFTKGAIYRHFENKEALEKAALIQLTTQLLSQLHSVIRTANTGPAKLLAILDYYDTYISNPPIEGGCPILNAATEMDDSRPELEPIVQQALELMHASLTIILKNGIRHNQFNPDIDVPALSSFIIASLEGAVMMSKLTRNEEYLHQVTGLLREKIKHVSPTINA